MGRFISEDPIGFAGGTNFYRYVQNNPVNGVDFSGERVSMMLRPMFGGAWALGYHAAINVNGQIYGFHPEGVLKENPADYAGWGSHEVTLSSSNQYDKAMLNYVVNAAVGNDPRFTPSTYNVLGNSLTFGYRNNCQDFVTTGTREVMPTPALPALSGK
jgi:uncharacterized protein RhaS with RHS repeats